MRIQHNIAALNSYRQLGTNNSNVSKNLEKLSSGYRINKAGDDAAGLSISEKMRAQITGLETAQANAQDGISLIQTAEGNLQEVHSMLNRMVELATQSSNGTYSDFNREQLQKEITSLNSEVDRIAESANFNGLKLLDGSLSGGSKAGDLTGTSIVKYKGAQTAAVTGANASTGTDFFAKDTINIDGTEIKVDWSKLTDTEKTALQKNWGSGTTASIASEAKTAANILQNTINESIKAHNAANGTHVQEIKVESSATGTAAKFTFTSGQKDGDSKIEFTGGATSVLGKIAGTTKITANAPTQTLSPLVADLNGKFTMKLGDQTLEVDMSTTNSATGAADVATKLQDAIDDALANYDTSNGLTGDEAMSGKVKVTLNSDGALEFVNNTGKSLAFEDKNGGEFAKNLGISAESKSINGGGLTLQVGDTNESHQKVTISIGKMDAKSLNLAGINVSTQEGAASAITAINSAIDTVSATRGDLGALQNRLDHTINNIGVAVENMTAAESRIRDTDMAKEMMDFTKNNILTQAAQAMLAQANTIPQSVLQLLQ